MPPAWPSCRRKRRCESSFLELSLVWLCGSLSRAMATKKYDGLVESLFGLIGSVVAWTLAFVAPLGTWWQGDLKSDVFAGDAAFGGSPTGVGLLSIVIDFRPSFTDASCGSAPAASERLCEQLGTLLGLVWAPFGLALITTICFGYALFSATACKGDAQSGLLAGGVAAFITLILSLATAIYASGVDGDYMMSTWGYGEAFWCTLGVVVLCPVNMAIGFYGFWQMKSASKEVETIAVGAAEAN